MSTKSKNFGVTRSKILDLEEENDKVKMTLKV